MGRDEERAIASRFCAATVTMFTDANFSGQWACLHRMRIGTHSAST